MRNRSHFAVSAALSVAVVIGVGAWRLAANIHQKDTDLHVSMTDTSPLIAHEADTNLAALLSPQATSSTAAEISQIGEQTVRQMATAYAVLAHDGTYTPELGSQIAAHAASALEAKVPYTTYSEQDIRTDIDTSRKRVLSYRTDLQGTLKPLMKNKTYELALYNSYMQTHDEKYLAQMKAAAQNYRDAATQTAKLVVPKDAVSIHVDILNAMQKFAATLDMVVDNTQDPITSLALLKSYNTAEADMFNSFNALNDYEAQQRS